MTKVVAFMPLKLNNERLPNKNTKSFQDGEPLLKYMLNTLIKSNLINEVYVYCSNESVKKYLPTDVKYLNRDSKLDTNSTSINEVMGAFSKDVKADVYVLAHATAPYISLESIEEGLTKVLYSGYDSAFSVKKIQEFLWEENRNTPLNYDLNNVPRTQDLQPIFAETTGLYIYKRELIERLNRRIGNNPYMIKVSQIEAVDINTEEDFLLADALFGKVYKNLNNEV